LTIHVAGSPLVTVVVTVHKRIDFLAQALRSVLTQTFTNYEVIVADDSGTGAARLVCASFAEDRRLRYCANAQTLGVAASVRLAVEQSRARYISILNDDDVWEAEFLARLVRPLEEDDRRVLAFGDHWIINEDGTLDVEASDRNTDRYGRSTLPEGDLADAEGFVLVQNGVPLAMGSLFRRTALDSAMLVPKVAGAYDFWISCLLAASAQRFYYVPARLTRYRVHSRMETARRSPEKSACLVFIFKTLLEKNYFPARRSYLRKKLHRARLRVAKDHLLAYWPAPA
jgi:glycosyltransferase involved in cell wall biosynthesis